MNFTQVHPDVGIVSNWHGLDTTAVLAKYMRLKVPTTQLLLTSITQHFNSASDLTTDLKKCKPILKADGWEPIGWYPSCHGPMAGYRVWLYAKLQKDVPLSAGEYKVSWSQLHCSVVYAPSFITVPHSWYDSYHHGVIGLRRIELAESPREDEVKRWKKFATTDLATYWFWGLEPKEKDLYKLEPDLKPTEEVQPCSSSLKRVTL